jgi:hypothetical protein
MSTSTSIPAGTGTPTGQSAQTGIDPRGPRFVAGLTVVVVAAALLAPTNVGLALTGLQAVLFAIGAVRGVQGTPQSWLFRTFVRPRLGAPADLEDPAPPRFAQTVGLAFLVVALIGFVSGVTLLAQVALGFALAAAILNSVFAFCLGCEVYLLLKRFSPPPENRWLSRERSERVETTT